MARGKNIRSARDAARHFQHMLRIQGRVVLDVDGSLWVLGCSEDETSRGLGAGCDPFALCSLLREPAAPRAARLAALLAATDRVEVTAGRLGKWSHSLLILEAAMPDIERWIADGHAALRKWRGHDLPALLESWRTALERCSLMHRRCTALAARGLLGGGEFEDGEQLLTILELAASKKPSSCERCAASMHQRTALERCSPRLEQRGEVVTSPLAKRRVTICYPALDVGHRRLEDEQAV